MTRFFKQLIFIVTIAIITMASSTAIGANRTPGDDKGADHTAFYFGPYRLVWLYVDYMSHTKTHVCSWRRNGPTILRFFLSGDRLHQLPTSQVCTIASFHSLISNNNQSLATLLIDTHGSTGIMAIESFAKTPAGRVARDLRY